MKVIYTKRLKAGIAQSVERVLGKNEVNGSNPFEGSIENQREGVEQS